jgi:peptidoglycan hydrolase-like protein with peptidoglycan-binding domain
MQRARLSPARRPDRRPRPPTPAPAVARVLALQRSAGNAATSRLLARSSVDPAEDLKSARYAGEPQLEAAYDNAPALAIGMQGWGVAAVQEGLVDRGHELPISMKSGKPDGIYGEETKAAVLEFQGTEAIGIDGIVGRETMGRLDALAGGNREGTPEIGDDPKSLGGHVAEQMEHLNRPGALGPERGLWYRDNYFAAHKSEPDLYRWEDDWHSGYADPRYFNRIGDLHWTLRPGKSASAALREFLNGLTIADCACAIVAVELDAMRAALGDEEFDRRHGSENGASHDLLLTIGQNRAGTPLETGMTVVDVGKRDLRVGDWVAFVNHPMYLLKHPGGDWQGENSDRAGPAGGDGPLLQHRPHRLRLRDAARHLRLRYAGGGEPRPALPRPRRRVHARPV